MIEQGETHEFSRTMNKSCRVRMTQLVLLALPYTITGGLDIIIQMVSLSYSGRLSSSVYQSGLGFGISVVNVFGFSLLYGLAFGYDTLGSQAIGAQNYKKAGQLFNKAKLILVVVSLILSPVFMFTGNFLRLISVQEGIADSVNMYLRIVFFGVILKPQSILIRIHMKAQRMTWPTFVSQLISLILHFGWLQLFIEYFEFGFEGICIATLIAFSTEFLGNYIFLNCLGSINQDTLQPFTKQDFKGWKQLLAIGLPTMMTVFAEWAAFEVMNIAVTYLGAESLAAQAILSSILCFLYFVANGFGNTLTSLVGNSIGQGDAKLAKKFYKQGTTFTILIAIAQSSLFYYLSSQIFTLFAADSQILSLCNQTALYLAVESVFDQLQCILSNVLRGLAIVRPVSLAMILLQWIFYVPLQIGFIIIYLQSMPGIWVVQAITMIILSAIFFLFLVRADWEAVAMETHLKMMRKSSLTEVILDENMLK